MKVQKKKFLTRLFLQEQNLYFVQRQDQPFEPEVEELILEKAKQETMVFSHLPHALSVEAEQKASII